MAGWEWGWDRVCGADGVEGGVGLNGRFLSPKDQLISGDAYANKSNI